MMVVVILCPSSNAYYCLLKVVLHRLNWSAQMTEAVVNVLLRREKQTPLSHVEMDKNFEDLQDKVNEKAPLTGEGAGGTWDIDITGNAGNVDGIVQINHGGTGAATPEQALVNLGAYPANNPNNFVSEQNVTDDLIIGALGYTPINAAMIDQPDGGLATLDSLGKVKSSQLPSILMGSMLYIGVWDATLNVPELVSSAGEKGHYYKVSVAGSVLLDGTAYWEVGDLVIFNGVAWDRVEGGSTEVTSVAGRVGNIVLTAVDISGLLQLTYDAAVDLGSASAGVSLTAARSDHRHEMPNIDHLADVLITDKQIGDTLIWTGSSWDNTPQGETVSGTAAKLATPRDITISGDVDGVAAFDGSEDIDIVVELADTTVTPATYGSSTHIPVFDVDAKGRITGVTNTLFTVPELSFTNITGKPTTLLGYGITDAVNINNVGVANGLATLGSDGKLTTSQLPDSVVGALIYQGVWNADTNTPTLVNETGTKGHYYKVSVVGTTSLDGNAYWQIGDLAIFDGTVWERVEGGSTEVTTVAGRVGNVVLTPADIAGLEDIIAGLSEVSSVAGRTGDVVLGISDITGLQTVLDDLEGGGVSSVAGETGVITAAALRLALEINNVDNVSGANAVVSTAQAAADAAVLDAANDYTDTAISSDNTRLLKTGGSITGAVEIDTNSTNPSLTINNAGGGDGIEVTGISGSHSVYIGITGATNNPYLAISNVESGYSMIDANGMTVQACHLVLATAGVEQMRITKDGNVLIGKTTDNASGKLQVVGDSSFVGDIVVDGVIREKHGTDIPSALSINLTNATGNQITITGTTGISEIILADGEIRRCRFAGILTLTNSANLMLQGGANITTAANDLAFFIGDADDVVRCLYFRANGTSLVSSGSNTNLTFDDRDNMRAIDGPATAMVNVDSLGSFIWTAGSTEIDDDESCFATTSGRWLMIASHPDFEYSRRYNDMSVLYDAIAAVDTALTTLSTRIIQGTHTCTLSTVGAGTVATYTVNVPGAKVNSTVTVNFPPAFATTATYAYISGAIITEGVLTVSITVLSNKGGNLSGTNISGYQHLIVNS